MLRVRAVMLWLLMTALPLQGLAAAVMLHCAGQAAATAQGAHAHHGAAAHRDAHDAAAGHHGGAAQDAPQAAAADDAGQWPSVTHKCGVCAACFSVVAPAPAVARLQVASPPSVLPVAIPLVPDSRAPALPDKPPRA